MASSLLQSEEVLEMDTTVFMKWFDETFCHEVWRRTRRPVLLLLDNAPGHTKEFTRANITVKFFPPNVTAWKQPIDMGIIAALKKRYKFLILADIIAFNDLPAGAKQSMQQAAQIMRPGAAGVKHGKPATLLDAAEYAVEAWKHVSQSAIRNCFRKADIVSSCRTEDVTNEPDNFDDFLSLMRTCSISHQLNVESVQDAIEYVLHVDDEDHEEYQQKMLKDIDDVIRCAEHGIVSQSDSEENEEEQEQGVPDSCGDVPVELSAVISAVMAHTIDFQRLHMQGTVAEKEMRKCMDDLSRLQNSLKNANSAVNRNRTQRVRQLTLHDFLNK